MKIGRNDPCWCGSGKKYKKCHLDHDQSNKVPTTGEVIGILGRSRRQAEPKLCLYPKEGSDRCRGPIVNCHTVQNKGALKRISDKGHVLGFNLDDQAAVIKSGQISIKRQGVKRASTFTGFCQRHDKRVFSEVEDQAFVPTKRQCFLLAYRGICLEFYKKHTQNQMLQTMRHLAGLEWGDFLKPYEAGVSKGLEDSRKTKQEFDQVLITGDLDRVECFAVVFDDIPKVACTSAFFPYNDFSDVIVQELDDLEADVQGLGFCLTPTNSGGAAVFAFSRGSQACQKFIESIRRTELEDLPDAIVRLVFSNFENTFFSPHWWEGLSPSVQNALHQRIETATSSSHGVVSLRDDGIHAADWCASDRFFLDN